ncbi:MAG: hypothetical protein KDM81_06655, partial [Verrucomicrobiae bacterium]|nr:hypothetical protein [Verrucomicrobiae bacterium]
VRTYQVSGADNQGLIALAEKELAGDLGPNVADLQDPSHTYNAATGYFEVTTPVNFRGDIWSALDNGEFVAPDHPDVSLPGLTGAADQAAAEAIAFIEFPAAGLYEMGVASDDCFKLTTWHNPRDRFALTIGEYDGTRSMTESRVLLLRIPEPGIYPFRCLWANQSGANGWEWYIFDASGERLLVNDPANTVGVAYREGPMRPYVVSVYPDLDAQGVSPTVELVVEIKDDVLKVAAGSASISVDDGAVAGVSNVTTSGGVTTVKFTPDSPLELGSTHTATLVYADTGSPSFSVTDTWSFTVSSAIVSPNAAVAAGEVDMSQLGVRVFAHQLDGADFDNQASLLYIRSQLDGLLGANRADLSGADGQGFFYLTNPLAGGVNCVNFNNFYEIPEKGNFTSDNGFADIQFPGTPGTGGLDWDSDNLATEVFTYLNFEEPGGYTMGIRAWDSFSVTIGDEVGRSPKDLFATVLADYDGDAPGNYLFSFYVPEAGIYPVRLIHNIGIQQGDLEWFTVEGPSATPTLINAPGGLKGYARGPALAAYVRRVTPGVNIAGLQDLTTVEVPKDTIISAEIVDDGTTVLPANVSLTLDGQGQSTATKSGNLTTVELTPAAEFEPGSEHTATLVYTDSAGTSFTDTWKFVVEGAYQLDPAMSYPPGSGDPAKRGFAMKIVQLALPFVSGESSSVTKSEGMLAGVFLDGQNVANLDGAVDGWFHVDTVNFGTEVGAITPDDPMPGLPGTAGHSDHYAAEFRTYVEFPEAGSYTMYVYSDGSPRLMQAEAQNQHFGAVEIVSPCEAAGRRITMAATRTSIGSGFGADLPTTPLVLPLVVADPPLGDAELVNADQIKDGVALIRRGAVAFGIKAANAKAAGAKAVIIYNDDSGDRADRSPIFMGGTATGVDIPCLFIGNRDGVSLVSLLEQGPVTVNLQDNPEPMLLEPNDGYYGTWEVPIYVPQPGLYPLRLVTGNGDGTTVDATYGIEWTVVKADGSRVLLNSAGDAEALRCFRGVTQRPEMLVPTRADSGCGEVEVSWRGSGRLLEADSVSGPYTPSQDQSMPHVEHGATQKYFK